MARETESIDNTFLSERREDKCNRTRDGIEKKIQAIAQVKIMRTLGRR